MTEQPWKQLVADRTQWGMSESVNKYKQLYMMKIIQNSTAFSNNKELFLEGKEIKAQISNSDAASSSHMPLGQADGEKLINIVVIIRPLVSLSVLQGGFILTLHSTRILIWKVLNIETLISFWLYAGSGPPVLPSFNNKQTLWLFSLSLVSPNKYITTKKGI